MQLSLSVAACNTVAEIKEKIRSTPQVLDLTAFPFCNSGCVMTLTLISNHRITKQQLQGIICQKHIEVNDKLKLHIFYEKHKATEVAVDTLHEEYKGYVD
ncbi:40S ribosomal protein S6 [Cricetulus griseus]|nr:40S ribosomal protein S6 [Cricetulus griseus]